MAVQIKLKDNMKSVRRSLGGVQRDVSNKAAMRGLNRAAAKGKTFGVRLVAKKMGLKGKDVRAAVVVKKASTTRLIARIIADGAPLGLMKFQARQTRNGVSAKAYGSRRVYHSTFIAPDKNGKARVFVRKGAARLPIRQVYGPGIGRTFNDDDVVDEIRDVAGAEFVKEYRRQVRLALARRASRGSSK